MSPVDPLRLLGEALDADSVGYALTDLSAETVAVEAVWHASDDHSRFELAFDEFLFGSGNAEAESGMIADRTSQGRLNIRVLEQGKTLGFLFVHAHGRKDWTDAQIAVAKFAAAQLGGAVALARIDTLRRNTRTHPVHPAEAMPAHALAPPRPDTGSEAEFTARKRERDLLWKTSSDLFAIADTNYVPIALNPAWTHMLGWTQRDMHSRHPIEICHVDDRALSIAALDRLVKDGDRITVENRLIRKDGGLVWLQWDISRFDDKVYATGRNITALRELIKAQNDLAHASRIATLGEMAASIAHEVNQPLTAICTNGNGARRWLNRLDPDLGEVGDALDRMVSEANRASQIISRIRSLALRKEPDRAPCDTAALVADSVELVRAQLRTLQVSIDIAHCGEPDSIIADRVQLQQVIIVLLLNAAQAMAHAESPIRRVTLSVDGQADRIRFTIADTGPGIDPASVSTIFDAFFTTKADGMGMGLSIARSIVEAHGGLLALDASSASGASFSFFIPRNEATAGNPKT